MESSDEEISSEEEAGSEEQVRAFVFSGLVGRFAGMQVCSMTALNLPAAALCLPALGFGCCGGWGKVCTFAGLCSGCFKPSCCSPVLACLIARLGWGLLAGLIVLPGLALPLLADLCWLGLP